MEGAYNMPQERSPFNRYDKKRLREEELRRLQAKGYTRVQELAMQMSMPTELVRSYLKRMEKNV
jgi:hypothetical protein